MGDLKVVDDLKCPECGGEEFQLGPRGGAARNIRCRCGHRLSVTPLPGRRWWVEDLDSAVPALPAAATK